MSILRLKSIFPVFVFLCSLYGIVLMPPAVADTQYVSDLLIISIKEGQDPDASVLGYLRSAAAVEVLEETQELMRIQTEDGTQGWVRKKFIVKDKPKAVIIRELEENIALLEEDLKTFQEGSDSQGLTNTIKENRQQIAALSASLETEKKRSLAFQENLAQVNTKHQALVNKHKNTADSIKELASLREENKALKDKIAAMPPPDSNPMLSGNMKWFLIGGGVLLLGFLIGRVVKRGEKRTYRY
jgi:SH3 domain protein